VKSERKKSVYDGNGDFEGILGKVDSNPTHFELLGGRVFPFLKKFRGFQGAL